MTDTESGHTPTPWEIDPRARTHIVGVNSRHVASTGGYSSNHPDDRDTHIDENDANAATIVEAVNNHDRLTSTVSLLMEALEWAMGYVDYVEPTMTAMNGIAAEAFIANRDKAREALARGRGEGSLNDGR